MKGLTFIILFLHVISVFSGNCIEEKDFIRFKYNDVEFHVSEQPDEGRENRFVWFVERDICDYIIGCSEIGMGNLFGIIINRTISAGETYAIYNSSLEIIIPDIWIRLGDDSSIKSYKTQKGIIGKITITEKTENRLSGNFNCKLENGVITDGEFSVRRKQSKWCR